MADKVLKIIPLGGLGEIGVNCMVFVWGKDAVLIDCGIQFPDDSFPGVELFAPDFDYLIENELNILGVVVTHGHEDHIGAIPYLISERGKKTLDIYATPFPTGLITHKLDERGLKSQAKFHPIVPRKRFKVGPFEFDPISVQHSIPEALGFGVETPVGRVVHSGDFKHDPNPVKGQVIGFEPFEEWGKKGVNLLFSDSTNAESLGHSLSETDISGSFEGILKKQTGRIFICLFASNVRRVNNLMWMAKKLGKKVALVGRSMHSYTQLAHEGHLIDIPEDTLVLAENADDVSDKDLIVLATGSQAEPQSAMVRIAFDLHKDLSVKEGDTVLLSSRFIPGNEQAITNMINQLWRQGAEVIYEWFHKIHVSGHGFQDELLLMLNSVKPKHFVPIHGEYRHLCKHARLAKDSGVKPENIKVVEDGQVLELSEKGLSLGDKLDICKQAIVLGQPMAPTEDVFKNRKSMAKAGIVFACTIVDKKTKKPIADPSLVSHGLLLKRGEGWDETHDEAVEVAYEAAMDARKSENQEEEIRLALRRYFRDRASYKPIVISRLLEIT